MPTHKESPMSTSQSTLNYILDQTGKAKVSARKMFGEYTLYCNEKVIGLVCDDTLFIKITPKGKDFVGEHYHEGPPYAGAKPAMVIDSGQIEDDEWLTELIAITEKVCLRPNQNRRVNPRNRRDTACRVRNSHDKHLGGIVAPRI